MDSDALSVQEAYAAMYAYLEAAYERFASDEIAVMLGEMSTLADGSTADPAVWHDWLQCIDRAKKKQVDTSLRLS